MKTIILDLLRNRNCPTTSIKIINTGLRVTALIDTGASIPVWVASKEYLLELGAESLDKKSSFIGFGGTAEGDLYSMPLFNVGDLVYPHMPIILCENLFEWKEKDEKNNAVKTEPTYHIILSATMFNDTIYEINNIDKVFRITVPNDDLIKNLKVYSSDGVLKVLLTSDKLNRSSQLEKASVNARYLAMIDRGIAQLEAGKGQQHDLIEVFGDE